MKLGKDHSVETVICKQLAINLFTKILASKLKYKELQDNN